MTAFINSLCFLFLFVLPFRWKITHVSAESCHVCLAFIYAPFVAWLKSMLELLGKFQMLNQMTAWQIDVVHVLGLALAVLVRIGEALLRAVVFFHIPIKRTWWSRHSQGCFAHCMYFTYCVSHLVHNSEDSGQQRVLKDVMQRNARMEGWNTTVLFLWSCFGHRPLPCPSQWVPQPKGDCGLSRPWLFNEHHMALESIVKL